MIEEPKQEQSEYVPLEVRLGKRVKIMLNTLKSVASEFAKGYSEVK